MLLLLPAAASGCRGDTVTVVEQGPVRLRVFNDSRFTLTNVQITTGPDASFTEARLVPGELSAEHLVTVMHTNPAASVTAEGETLTASPIEGFSPGYNAPVAAGNYVIDLTLSGSPRRLIVTLTSPVENTSRH